MKLKELAQNVHILDLESTKRHDKISIGMLSDIHWDNPKCDRVKLKEDLDNCLENNYRIHINGDTLCLMQGKYDPRKSKGSIRPEHNKDTYLDAVIETAADYFKPYAHLIDVIGYGNHETNIIKRLETDPLQRLVDTLNAELNDHKIYTGGYGGWYIIKFRRAVYRIRYFHGSGGGGVVTRGEINLTRALQFYEGFDCFTMGHVHENKESVVMRNTMSTASRAKDKEIILMITGTYKEEYNGGYMGWHVERGAPPKAIGSRILDIEYREDRDGTKIKASSRKF